MAELITQEMIDKYAASDGVCCLFCGGTSVEGGRVEIEGNSALQEMSCADCDGFWTDTYAFKACI